MEHVTDNKQITIQKIQNIYIHWYLLNKHLLKTNVTMVIQRVSLYNIMGGHAQKWSICTQFSSSILFSCRKYRHVAYRQLTRWCWGWLGRHNGPCDTSILCSSKDQGNLSISHWDLQRLCLSTTMTRNLWTLDIELWELPLIEGSNCLLNYLHVLARVTISYS